ncbi:MAG: hypothetical protein AABZ53_05175 [Planctomycetota bacterium]
MASAVEASDTSHEIAHEFGTVSTRIASAGVLEAAAYVVSFIDSWVIGLQTGCP